MESGTNKRSLPNAVVLIPERTLEAKADDDEEEVEVEGDEEDEDDVADAEVAVLASASFQCSPSTFWILRSGLLLLLQESGEQLLRLGRGAEGRCRKRNALAAMADGLDIDGSEAPGIMLLAATARGRTLDCRGKDASGGASPPEQLTKRRQKGRERESLISSLREKIKFFFFCSTTAFLALPVFTSPRFHFTKG